MAQEAYIREWEHLTLSTSKPKKRKTILSSEGLMCQEMPVGGVLAECENLGNSLQRYNQEHNNRKRHL